jgi:hypothetical protein
LEQHAHILNWIACGDTPKFVADHPNARRAQLTLKDALDVLAGGDATLGLDIPPTFVVHEFRSPIPIKCPEMFEVMEKSFVTNFTSLGKVRDHFLVEHDEAFACERMRYAKDVADAFHAALSFWHPEAERVGDRWENIGDERAREIRANAYTKLLASLAGSGEWGVPFLTATALKYTVHLIHSQSLGFRSLFAMVIPSSAHAWLPGSTQARRLPKDQSEYFFEALYQSDPLLAQIEWTRPKIWEVTNILLKSTRPLVSAIGAAMAHERDNGWPTLDEPTKKALVAHCCKINQITGGGRGPRRANGGSHEEVHPLLERISNGELTSDAQQFLVNTFFTLLRNNDYFDPTAPAESPNAQPTRFSKRLHMRNGIHPAHTTVSGDVALTLIPSWRSEADHWRRDMGPLAAMCVVDTVNATYRVPEWARLPGFRAARFILKKTFDKFLPPGSGPEGDGYRFPDHIRVNAEEAQRDHRSLLRDAETVIEQQTRALNNAEDDRVIQAFVNKALVHEFARASPFLPKSISPIVVDAAEIIGRVSISHFKSASFAHLSKGVSRYPRVTLHSSREEGLRVGACEGAFQMRSSKGL